MVANRLHKSHCMDALLNLARSCKLLSYVIRPILFRDLQSFSLSRPDVGKWSTTSICNILDALARCPKLRSCVRSISYTGNRSEHGDPPKWDVASQAQKRALVDGLYNRHVDKYYNVDGATHNIRDYPLQLTLLLCLVQKTISRACFAVPEKFWIPPSPPTDDATLFSRYNISDCPKGIMLKEMPTFESLVDVTLEAATTKLNPRTVRDILSTMPNITRLTFRNCYSLAFSDTIVVPEHVSSLALDRSTRLRRLRVPGNNTLKIHNQLKSISIDERLSDLCGIYAGDLGVEKQLVLVRPDEKKKPDSRCPSSKKPYPRCRSSWKPAYNVNTQLLKFLSPAATSLERIYLGDCGYPYIIIPPTFSCFPNLQSVSIHCSNLHPDVGNDVLVDLFKDCKALKVIELVGIDEDSFSIRFFVAFAVAVMKKPKSGLFPQLQKVILVCHDPGCGMPLILDPFASMFVRAGVKLVLYTKIFEDQAEVLQGHA